MRYKVYEYSDGKRSECRTFPVGEAPGEYMGLPLSDGRRETRSSARHVHINASEGFVDTARPPGWGKDVVPGGFAKHYNENDEPYYTSNRDMEEALAKARDHGEDIRSVRVRDMAQPGEAQNGRR